MTEKKKPERRTSNMMETAAVFALTGKEPDELIKVSSPKGIPFVMVIFKDSSEIPEAKSLRVVGTINGQEVSAPLLFDGESDGENIDLDSALRFVKREKFFKTLDDKKDN